VSTQTPSATTAATSHTARPRSTRPNGTARYQGVPVIGLSNQAPTRGRNQAGDDAPSQHAMRAAADVARPCLVSSRTATGRHRNATRLATR